MPIGRTAIDEDSETDESIDEKQEQADVDDSVTMKPLPLFILKRDGMASPAHGLFSMPNVTMRKNIDVPSKSLPKYITSPDINRYGEHLVDVDGDDDETLANMTTLSFTESEWLCKTPSPVRNDSEHARIQNLWSPSVGGQKSRLKESESLRKKAINWYENLRNSAEPESSPVSTASGVVKIKGSNWI